MRHEWEQERQARELATWQEVFEARAQAARDAIDRGAPLPEVARLAWEARAAEINVQDVQKHGRILSRADRRRLGEHYRVENGYVPPVSR